MDEQTKEETTETTETTETKAEVFDQSAPEGDDGLQVWSMGAGLIVALDVRASGGKHYTRKLVDSHTEVDEETGEVVLERTDTLTRAVWTAPEERRKAEALCTWARRAVQSVCARTVIGLVAPEAKRTELGAIIAEIRAEVQTFNDASKTCEVVLSAPVYQIAPQDQETIAALAAQLDTVTAQLQAAIEGDEAAVVKSARSRARGKVRDKDGKERNRTVADVLAMPQGQERDSVIAACRADVLRKTIAQVKGFDELLDGEASLAVKDLVTSTRAVATELRKRVDKDEETLAAALTAVDTSGINLARAAFVAAHRKARAAADADLSSEVGTMESPVKRYVRKGGEQTEGTETETETAEEKPAKVRPATRATPAAKPRKVRKGKGKASGDGDDGGDGSGAKAPVVPAATPRKVAGGWRRRGKRHTVTDEDSSATGGNPA
jgi:hypothetical protein